MPLGDAYLDSMRRFEGFRPKPYWDYRQWTSGYGTRASGPGDTVDRQEAERRFRTEVGGARDRVRGFGASMTPGQEAALTSLTYNAGPSWMNQGLGAAVRAGNWTDARQRFLQYVNAGGQPLEGLRNRRAAEAQWFDQPGQSAPQAAPAAPMGAGLGGLTPPAQPPAEAPIPSLDQFMAAARAPAAAVPAGGEPPSPSLGPVGADRFRSGTDLATNFMPAPNLPPMPPFSEGAVSPAPQPSAGKEGVGLAAAAAPPGIPPGMDADAVVRGAESAAASRPPAPGFAQILHGLASNPLFMAGLSILGTAPGGNWGPNGAQAAMAATRGQREQSEYERLQNQRAMQTRVWSEAFPNGQPNMEHPLLRGVPPEMAATLYGMGPEEGLGAAQRWQMFRGQQAEQLRALENRMAIAEGRAPSPAGAPPGMAPAAPPVGAGMAGGMSAPQAPAAPQAAPGPAAAASAEPTVSYAGETMTLGEAQRRARRADLVGMRNETLEKAIAEAAKSSQPPEAVRTRGILIDNAYQSILPELQRYSQLVQQSGWTAMNNSERDAVQQARTNLTLQIKELYQLGALQDPDIQIINKLLLETDPGLWNNNPITSQNPSSRVGSAMQRLEVKLRELRNNAVRPLGMPPISAPAISTGEGYRVLGVR